MGWFWADQKVQAPVHQSMQEMEFMGPGCPVMRVRNDTPKTGCPVMLGNDNGKSGMNPLNFIPENLPTGKQAGQKLDLPTNRSVSSIPKGSDSNDFWEYPSPQQMYNAMVKKGKLDPNTGEEIPEDAVESMVEIHNFLNEGCWQEILRWEQKHTAETHIEPKLLKFMGRPGELSPRARWYQALSKVFPSKYSGELPFDRHDWFVLRGDPNSTDPDTPGYKRIRYVIDFYSGPDDINGMPTFNLDVRPAIDGLTGAKDRFDNYISK